MRVLYSFPHRLGASRICTTAWHQIAGADAAGAEVTAVVGSIVRPLPPEVRVIKTLEWGMLRFPYRLLGTDRVCAYHDWRVARMLPSLAKSIDVIHLWPLAAYRTLKMARRLGIPTVLERPNAHTQFAYDIVADECRRLGISMPSGHEHAFNASRVQREIAEYDLADGLLCPSDFVARTFSERGYSPEKLLRHQYGFDHTQFHPSGEQATPDRGLNVLFAGGCAPRKGLHYALEAWLRSEAHKTGKFLIAGAFIPGYAERCASMLAHPSVQRLGHRSDLPALMSQADVLVLPSIEEGSALVTSEARGSGCVLLVSDAAGAIVEHGKTGLVHAARDVNALTEHFNQLHRDRVFLATLRQASLASVSELTWDAAGRRLVDAYELVARQSAPLVA